MKAMETPIIPSPAHIEHVKPILLKIHFKSLKRPRLPGVGCRISFEVMQRENASFMSVITCLCVCTYGITVSRLRSGSLYIISLANIVWHQPQTRKGVLLLSAQRAYDPIGILSACRSKMVPNLNWDPKCGARWKSVWPIVCGVCEVCHVRW